MAANTQPIFPKIPNTATGVSSVTFTGAANGSRVDTVVLANTGGTANTAIIDILFGSTVLRQIAVGALVAGDYTEEEIDKSILSGATIVVTSADANINITIFGGDY